MPMSVNLEAHLARVSSVVLLPCMHVRQQARTAWHSTLVRDILHNARKPHTHPLPDEGRAVGRSVVAVCERIFAKAAHAADHDVVHEQFEAALVDGDQQAVPGRSRKQKGTCQIKIGLLPIHMLHGVYYCKDEIAGHTHVSLRTTYFFPSVKLILNRVRVGTPPIWQ